MPDSEKISQYSQSRFENIQKSISLYTSVIKSTLFCFIMHSYQLGFSLIRTETPLLTELSEHGNTTMYLSLITDLLLLLLLYLSASLLYYLTKILVFVLLLSENRCIIDWQIIVQCTRWEVAKQRLCSSL